jgi:hypothetical protein
MWMRTAQAMGGRFRSTLPSDVRFVVRARHVTCCVSLLRVRES